jgi:Fur family ferric uptake transcriptional regulator
VLQSINIVARPVSPNTQSYNFFVGNPLLERIRERSYHALLDRGLKLTKPRIAVLDFLLASPESQFQPEEIHARLNKKTPGMISRPTVYRTLDLLVEAGIVSRTIINANKFRYQLSEGEHHACHYSLVDLNSGASVSFDADPELRRVLQRICRERGFTEQYHELRVFGEFKRQRRKRVPSANGSAPTLEYGSAAANAAPRIETD